MLPDETYYGVVAGSTKGGPEPFLIVGSIPTPVAQTCRSCAASCQ
jgi:hypothetical protein